MNKTREFLYNGLYRKVIVLREDQARLFCKQIDGGSISGGELPFDRTFFKSKIVEIDSL